jgi:hypothetical protein
MSISAATSQRTARWASSATASGTLSAFFTAETAGSASLSPREEAIRTLGVGLVTLAAMLISLSAARQRAEPRRHDLEPATQRTPGAPALDLDAIRSAGF